MATAATMSIEETTYNLDIPPPPLPVNKPPGQRASSSEGSWASSEGDGSSTTAQSSTLLSSSENSEDQSPVLTKPIVMQQQHQQEETPRFHDVPMAMNHHHQQQQSQASPSSTMEEGPQFREGAANRPSPSQATTLPSQMMPQPPLAPHEQDNHNNNNNMNTIHMSPHISRDGHKKMVQIIEDDAKLPDFSKPAVTKREIKMVMEQRTAYHKEALLSLYHAQVHDNNQESKAPLYQSSATSSSLSSFCPNNNGAHQFQACRDKRTFCLVSGPAGTGKSRLVQEALQNQVEHVDQGYFLHGKYDSLQRPVPYSGLVTAFSNLTAQVEQRGPEHVQQMRSNILRELGQDNGGNYCDNKSVLVSMIPSLGDILGCCGGAGSEAAEYKKSSNDNPIQRFVFAFRMFMRAIANPEHPVVVCLSNLHHADPCSLDILAGTSTMTCPPGLVLIGTVDDSAVKRDSYLAIKLREIEDSGMTYIANLALPPLFTCPNEMQAVLSQALQFPTDMDERDATTLSRLARLVLNQTNGNAFLVGEFVQWLQQGDMLNYYPQGSGTVMGFWKLCSQEDMEVTITLEHAGDFMVDKVNQLSHESKQVIKVCSCLGPTIDPEILEYVLDHPGVEKLLNDMTKRGFLTVSQNWVASRMTNDKYTFEHDGIQQAAYKCIPESERELFHLEIGRRLWRKLSATQLDSKLFIVLSQMYMGRRLITREKERLAISTLCLHAGKKAAKSSTFRVASLYLKMGIGLLDTPASWRTADQYDLTLALYCAAAEMELCCARFEDAKMLLEPVLQNARTFEDKIQAYTTQMFAFSQQDDQESCLNLGMWLLEQMGEAFPNRLCNAHLMKEYRTVERLLKGKSNEQLLRIPPMTDMKKIHALQVLSFMTLPALLHRPKLAPFVTLKCMRITLLHGSSVFSSGAYGVFGMMTISVSGDVERGARFAQLALRSLEQFKVYEYLPRVYAAVYGCIQSWTQPIQTTLDPLLHAYRVGMATGDAEYGGLCANLYCWNALDSGTPLPTIQRHWNGFKETLVTARQTFTLRQFLPTLQTIHHWMGLTDDPLSEKGDLVDFAQMEKEAEMRGTSDVCSLKYCRMMLGYAFLDTEFAEKNMLSCKEVMLMPPSFERVQVIFYMGLIFTQAAREGRKYRKNVGYTRRIIQWLSKYCRESPHNILGKVNLVKAEFSSLLGKDKEAYEYYLMCIAIANEEGHYSMHAMCNERFARHLLRLGEKKQHTQAGADSRRKAKIYMNRAIESYRQWGGMAKVTRLETEMESLYGKGVIRREESSGVSLTHQGSSSLMGNRSSGSGLGCPRC